MLFKLRMRDYVVLALKMILLMENLSRMKEKSLEKRVEENDIHLKRRSEVRRDFPSW